MKAVLHILGLMVRDQRTAMIRGAALSVLVLLMGAALLGLSGWFITAAAAAGMAGAGRVFDVFRPSAMVRFLALGRTAARYGERLLTHDATLRALTSLRVRVLRGFAAQPWEALQTLRAAQVLNRITADVDALDGISLRLTLPLMAGLIAHLTVMVVIGWLVDWWLAVILTAIFLVGAALVLVLGIRAATDPSRQAEEQAQILRSATVDLIQARRDLVVYGQLPCHLDQLTQTQVRRNDHLRQLDRIERRAGVSLSLTAGIAVAFAMTFGGLLAQSGLITPAAAAIAVFAALALFETLIPLRRALSDTGRIVQAARRVTAVLPGRTPDDPAGPVPMGPLRLTGVTFRRAATAQPILSDFSLTVAAGETVALTGPSGVGKSTLLQIAAGLIAPDAGQVMVGDCPLPGLSQRGLRGVLTYVPQRAALVQGSIAENLRLADPKATAKQMRQALIACQLWHVVEPRGGLDLLLGPGGSGLSGGEGRRLVLARALLRCPAILLLDEPTEGVDSATAIRVMQGMRTHLPQTAILLAAHRPEERAAADREIHLTRS